MSIDNVPELLKALPQWVNIKANSKVPMHFCGFPASTSDPTTWTKYSEARDAVRHNWYDNIGFVFHDNDIVGIDIDTGFNENGSVSDVARDIISRCQSYTELSRSGRGFHIILQGRLPFNGYNNRQGVELYQSGRYFIMTGKTYNDYDVIRNQEAIDYIVNTYCNNIRQPVNDISNRIYNPVYPKPSEHRICIRPQYSPIPQGCRNISLTSLAGQLRSYGMNNSTIYKELLRVNKMNCKPPLPTKEIELIINSINRYKW